MMIIEDIANELANNVMNYRKNPRKTKKSDGSIEEVRYIILDKSSPFDRVLIVNDDDELDYAFVYHIYYKRLETLVETEAP